MAIKSFQNKEAYDAASRSSIESQVSMIENSRQTIIDGVNVLTREPVVGDVLFLDESNRKVFVKGGSWLRKANIPTAWVHVGYVYMRKGRKVGVIDKTGTDEQYLTVWQYAITAIAQTSVTLRLRIGDFSKTGNDRYATAIDVPVTLADTAISAANAEAISQAVAAKAAEMGDTNPWWAWLDEENGRIIVQTDACANYQQSTVAATGCTIALSVWDEMPASTSYFKKSGAARSGGGIMNLARGYAYFSVSGTVPTADVALKNSAAPVTEDAFWHSEHCRLLRDTYGDYMAYLRDNDMVKYPQKYGAFALPDGAETGRLYAGRTAPTKDGGETYKFAALRKCHDVGYNADGLGKGDWHLPSVLEGCHLMDDETLALLAASIVVMGTTAITNAVTRWLAERCNAVNAWIFGGTYGTLGYGSVSIRYRAQAVTLLEIE